MNRKTHIPTAHHMRDRYSRLANKLSLLSLSGLLLVSGLSASSTANDSQPTYQPATTQNTLKNASTAGTKNNAYLDDFYAVVAVVTRPDASGGIRVESAARGLWFAPDGRYASTATGVGKFASVSEYCARYARNCGSYTVSNGRYTLRKDNGADPRTLTLSASGGELFDDNLSYNRIEALPPSVLNGRYRRLLSGSNGYIYDFDGDGNFSKSRTNRASNRRVVLEGTYEIENYTIVLRFDDGETDVRSFYFLEDAPFMDGDWYESLD
ncbi:MAG: hypothetical protein AAFQ95_19670 [Cyanobacteria bacterium J06621_3]